MLCQNASTVWPDRVRPDASTIVPEMISGTPDAELVEERLDREDRGLGVERVEDRLDEQDVRAALDQAGGRLAVGDLELLPGDVAGRRIVDVGADRGGPVGRAERAGDEPRAAGSRALGVIGGLARQPGGGHVDLADERPGRGRSRPGRSGSR